MHSGKRLQKKVVGGEFYILHHVMIRVEVIWIKNKHDIVFHFKYISPWLSRSFICVLCASGEPLHDWSGLQLDVESMQKLHHHNVALMHLVTIFQTLASHSASTTEQGRSHVALGIGNFIPRLMAFGILFFVSLQSQLYLILHPLEKSM